MPVAPIPLTLLIAWSLTRVTMSNLTGAEGLRAVLNVDEIAMLTGSSAWTIYKLVREGAPLPFPFIRLGRRVLFPATGVASALGVTPAELLAMLDAGSEEQSGHAARA